ncbi:MAG: cohesin domain-containing protein [Gemmatimonadaceae bacterium]
MRQFAGIAMLWCLLAAPAVGGAQACPKKVAKSETRFFIAPVASGPRDTVVVARVCLTASAKGIGSYMATITYDSTRLRVVRVDVSGGMQVANSRVAGTIRLAGASPGGFSSGQLVSVRFKPARSRTLGRIALVVSEASTPGGASLMGETRGQGWPADAKADQAAGPSVDSISPRAAEVGHERVTDLVLYGRRFAPAGNTVVFDGVEVTGLLSEAQGTIVRFAAPTWIPARGSSPAHQVKAGRVQVRLKHPGGTSNAVVFTVRDGDR